MSDLNMSVDTMIHHIKTVREVYEKANKNLSRKRSWKVSEKAMARLNYDERIATCDVTIQLLKNHAEEAQEILKEL